MNSIIMIFFCLIFVVIQQGIDGINCYACSAGTDGCGPVFKKSGSGVAFTSDSSGVYCTKTVFSSNTNAVSHSFGTSGTCTEGSSTTNGFTSYQYCCTTELCNGASIEKASFIFGIILSIIGLLLIK